MPAGEVRLKDQHATPPKHLVSSFALVDHDHIILVDHKYAERWLPTGGHVEPSATSALHEPGISHYGTEGHEWLEFKRFRFPQLSSMNLRPSFLRGVLASGELKVRHFVQRDSAL